MTTTAQTTTIRGLEVPLAPETAPGVNTLPKALRWQAGELWNRVAMREKLFGIWHEFTWIQYLREVRVTAMAFVALGLRHGDRVAVHSENRSEWVFADLGCQAAGGTTIGIYPTNPAAEVEYLLSDSGARFLVVEDQEQADKWLAAADRVPVEKVIYLEPRGVRSYDDPRLVFWGDFLEAGRELDDREPSRFDDLVSAGAPTDVAALIYTSGTTGPPKGVTLTQANAMSNVCGPNLFSASPRDSVLSYLPLCHVAEKIFTILQPLGHGITVSFAEDLDTVVENLREVSPTVFLGVPRIWEKMQAGIQIRINDASLAKRAMYKFWVGGVGNWLARRKLSRGNRHTPLTRVVYAAGWVFMFRALKGALGLRKVRFALSGAAPIAPEVLRFFVSLGVPIVEGYGMSESTGLGTITRLGDTQLGTVGTPVDWVDMRVDEGTGEILMRGPGVFTGYWNNPEATAATIVDGWLRTGDVGEWVGEGPSRGDWDGRRHLKITERMKDIIITSGGKNISPSEIENKLKVSPYVREAVVIGDRRKFLSALIGVEFDTVGDWALRRGIAYTTYRDLTEKPEVLELVRGVVDGVNRELAQVEQVKAFRLLPKELDHEDGELTATQKVKRATITGSFGDLVASMYGPT